MEHGGGPVRTSRAVPAVDVPTRAGEPPHFTGSFHHAVDGKHRLVLPAPFRSRLADGAYLGPLVGYLGLWPQDGFGAVLSRWKDGVELGIVSEQQFRAFRGKTYWVQPDGQGRIVVHQDLRDFAGVAGPVVIVGDDESIEVWAAARWENDQADLPEGRDAALRQAARDLRL
jgi:MraZ protein